VTVSGNFGEFVKPANLRYVYIFLTISGMENKRLKTSEQRGLEKFRENFGESIILPYVRWLKSRKRAKNRMNISVLKILEVRVKSNLRILI